MNEIVLSFIVAAYNAEKYISDCLASFLKIDNKTQIEVIIVNDGSIDATNAIALDYVNRYPNLFVLINKDNGGLGSALNAGIAVAKGKYVISLDSDDILLDDEFDDLIYQLDNIDVECFVYGLRQFSADGTMTIKDEIPSIKGNYTMDAFIKSGGNIFIHNSGYNTKWLKQIGFKVDEDYKLYTDVGWILYACPYIKNLYVVNNCIYGYRLVEGQSISLTGLIKNQESLYSMIEHISDFYLQTKKESIIDVETLGLMKRMIADNINTGYYLATVLEDKNILVRLNNIYSSLSQEIKISKIAWVIHLKINFINYLIGKMYRRYKKRC